VDFIFLDPPYQFGRYSKLLRNTFESAAFEPGRSLILLEIFRKTPVDFLPHDLQLVRNLSAGDSHLLFLDAVKKTP
jgi:16S rRNA G966 N2-methylase RsmD